MRIRVDDIKDGGMLVNACEQIDSFPELQQLADTGDLALTKPLCIHARAISVSGLVEVEGQVETSARLTCSRCLEEFESPLTIPFALTFARELPEVEQEEDEVELSAEELGLIAFEGEEIELHEAVEEQVLMTLPQRPLCSEGCKGLCPQCGTDLNRSACQCGKPEFMNKFAALKNFRVDKEDR